MKYAIISSKTYKWVDVVEAEDEVAARSAPVLETKSDMWFSVDVKPLDELMKQEEKSE